jgi:hypothetical protein
MLRGPNAAVGVASASLKSKIKASERIAAKRAPCKIAARQGAKIHLAVQGGGGPVTARLECSSSLHTAIRGCRIILSICHAITPARLRLNRIISFLHRTICDVLAT